MSHTPETAIQDFGEAKLTASISPLTELDEVTDEDGNIEYVPIHRIKNPKLERFREHKHRYVHQRMYAGTLGSGSKKGIKEQVFVLNPENFDIFPDTANRLGDGIARAHISALKKSMKGLASYQNHVNEAMKIVDGHHRFISAKELGIRFITK